MENLVFREFSGCQNPSVHSYFRPARKGDSV